MPKVVIDYNKCKTRAVCFDNCPVGVFEKKDGKVVVVHPETCTVCRLCEEGCPEKAVTVTEDE